MTSLWVYTAIILALSTAILHSHIIYVLLSKYCKTLPMDLVRDIIVCVFLFEMVVIIIIGIIAVIKINLEVP
jgi:hypothetical protein